MGRLLDAKEDYIDGFDRIGRTDRINRTNKTNNNDQTNEKENEYEKENANKNANVNVNTNNNEKISANNKTKRTERTERTKSNFQVFEMEHLMNLGEKNIVPILQILFHKIDNQLDGSPTLIVLDESWLFISHPIFREKIRSWLKVLRKNNTAVIFATQSISDITNSPIRDVIYESCPTKIFLPNIEANNDICKNEYLKIGFNESQINIIKNAIPKKQYYYTSPMGKRLFELNLGEVAMSFVGKSGKEDLKQVRALMNQNPNNWQEEWLRIKVSDEWADQYVLLDNIAGMKSNPCGIS
jgi:type IV secretory pathway VirB4 component